MLTRRTLLKTLSAASLWLFRPRLAQASSGLTVRYGWDPDVAAPTEASLYVATDGDDNADGSLAKPLRTLQRGVDLLATITGGSLSIRGGVYRESIRLDALQGQPQAPCRIHRHGKEHVQITAADVLTGWTPCPATKAAELGFLSEGVFVATVSAEQLQHGSIHALNLHEAGLLSGFATDRADISDPSRTGDQSTFHEAQFLLNADDKIIAVRDPRLIGLLPSQMLQVRVLVYHRPNLVSAIEITDFDPTSGTIVLADSKLEVQRSAKKPVMLYALQNAGAALGPGQWIVRRGDNGEVAVYLKVTDPANLDGAIEISTRSTCIDFGEARGVELFGLEVIRAAGKDRTDGICIRRTGGRDGTDQNLLIMHCRVGENYSAADRGYGALYLRGAKGVTVHSTSIGPAPSSFGLFLSDCTDADLRFLHISKVSKSPARFFGLRQAVLSFSLFEDSANDAHSNKFNFYEGSDVVLIYGVRTLRVGGYATYQEASRIHFAFCELDCDPASQNRALVSQNRHLGKDQGGANGSGEPMANSTFYYWNNSLLADPREAKAANSLSLGPGDGSQRHAFHNNILHGGGFADLYIDGLDRSAEQRSHNRYTGLSFWQSSRYGWRLGLAEEKMRVGLRPTQFGMDMRAIIKTDIAPLFPKFSDWDVDIDGNKLDWPTPPIGCRV
jgi:hypothetical protein